MPFRRLTSVTSVLLFLLVLSCGLLYSQGGKFGTAYISGTWSDACPCTIPCPCWKNHESSAEWCVNFHVFKIQTGSYDGVDLSGSVFVLVNLPQRSWEAPVADTLLVDTSDVRKSAAIENSLKQLFSFAPTKVSRGPIRYDQSGKKQRVSIPSLLDYRVSFERDQILSADVSENLYYWLSNPRQGLVESLVYSPVSGMTVKYANTNAISAEFHVRVPEH